MSSIRPSPKALVFYGLTAPRNEGPLLQKVSPILVSQHGSLLGQMEPFSFSELTSYYEKEMGPDLIKTFLLFRDPINLDGISSLKTKSNELEQQYSQSSHGQNGQAAGRRINIDPGVLTLFNFCLLTTKGFSHRVYLEKGIYAEVTLIAMKGKLQPLEWTYRDYASPAALSFLENGRQELRKALSLPKNK